MMRFGARTVRKTSDSESDEAWRQTLEERLCLTWGVDDINGGDSKESTG